MGLLINNNVPILCFILLAASLAFTQAARFDITNKCGYVVWAAVLPRGGKRLNSGETWNLNVSPGTAGARIWGRTNCNFNAAGRGSCGTGDCAGNLVCTGDAGRPPTTLAEFSLNRPNNLDFFDISVIDGFNVPMEFSSASPQCGVRLVCRVDKCPDAYLFPSDNTKTRSCPSGTNYKIVFCP